MTLQMYWMLQLYADNWAMMFDVRQPSLQMIIAEITALAFRQVYIVNNESPNEMFFIR